MKHDYEIPLLPGQKVILNPESSSARTSYNDRQRASAFYIDLPPFNIDDERYKCHEGYSLNRYKKLDTNGKNYQVVGMREPYQDGGFRDRNMARQEWLLPVDGDTAVVAFVVVKGSKRNFIAKTREEVEKLVDEYIFNNGKIVILVDIWDDARRAKFLEQYSR